MNKLQVLNEVTQQGITNSAQELGNRRKESQGLSVKIDDKNRDQEKLRQRHSYLQNEIKNCIPTSVGPDGQLVQRYHPDEVAILPD